MATPNRWSFTNETFARYAVDTIIKDNLYWRNTKESVKNEMNVPSIVEKVIFIEQTGIEKVVYQSAEFFNDVIRMRQLCCHSQISLTDRHILGAAPLTLEEIRVKMTQHNADELNSLTRKTLPSLQRDQRNHFQKKADLSNKLQQLQNSGGGDDGDGDDDENKKMEIKRLKSQLKITSQNIEFVKKKIDDTNDAIDKRKKLTSFFNSLIPRATELLSEPCLICFECITFASVTNCGHIFCANWFVYYHHHYHHHY